MAGIGAEGFGQGDLGGRMGRIHGEGAVDDQLVGGLVTGGTAFQRDLVPVRGAAGEGDGLFMHLSMIPYASLMVNRYYDIVFGVVLLPAGDHPLSR